MQHTFLKEPSVQCYLALDPAALAAKSSTSGNGTRDQSQQQQEQSRRKEALRKKVGTLCSEIVATCCYVMDVKDVGKLPQSVHAAKRFANLVPSFQQFLSTLQGTLNRLDEVR